MVKNRIVIPIHDHQGMLVAYCGRAVDEDQIEKEGKYKLPARFVKSEVVYNRHRQKDPGRLILVESFLSVFQLYQNDVENVVALMGSSMSEQQEELIVNALGLDGKVILLFDGDEDGQKCAHDCLTGLSKKLFVKPAQPLPKSFAIFPHQLHPLFTVCVSLFHKMFLKNLLCFLITILVHNNGFCFTFRI